MKPFAMPSSSNTANPHLDTLEARFGLQVAARLTQRSMELSPDITERLRFAREKALAQACTRPAAQTASMGITRAGAALLGGGSGWWIKLASILPAVLLVLGLMWIQQWQDRMHTSAAAEVDAALLADDLPPTAYKDPGFAEFLKTLDE
jgi:Protein of unknown function (DUF3619)